MTTLAFMHWQELLIIGLVAVLLFGRRLPEVGRNLGRALVEFKKGLRGVKDEVDETIDEATDTVSKSESDDEK
jgi:sec-independent protein translocase protein TatA